MLWSIQKTICVIWHCTLMRSTSSSQQLQHNNTARTRNSVIRWYSLSCSEAGNHIAFAKMISTCLYPPAQDWLLVACKYVILLHCVKVDGRCICFVKPFKINLTMSCGWFFVGSKMIYKILLSFLWISSSVSKEGRCEWACMQCAVFHWRPHAQTKNDTNEPVRTAEPPIAKVLP